MVWRKSLSSGGSRVETLPCAEGSPSSVWRAAKFRGGHAQTFGRSRSRQSKRPSRFRLSSFVPDAKRQATLSRCANSKGNRGQVSNKSTDSRIDAGLPMEIECILRRVEVSLMSRFLRVLTAFAFSFSLIVLPAFGQEAQDPTRPAQKPTKEAKRKMRQVYKELGEAYKHWLDEDVVYIIAPEERTAFLQLSTNEEREQFIEQFWLRRSSNPDLPDNDFKEEHYRRIAYANEHYASGVPGWKTDRGRMYIIWGPADEG